MLRLIMIASAVLCLDYMNNLKSGEDILFPPDGKAVINNPTIGIIALPGNEEFKDTYANDLLVYSEYTDFAFSAGAGVVSIKPDLSQDTITKLSQINGLIIQDGSTKLWNSDNTLTSYARNVANLLILASSMHNIPVLGIGAGFDLILLSLDSTLQMGKVQYSNEFIKLSLMKDRQPKIFSYSDPELFTAFSSNNYCFINTSSMITVQEFQKSKLSASHIIISTTEKNGVSYVTGFESAIYPMFALKIHPNMGNCMYNKYVPVEKHNEDTVKFSQYTANYFMMQARKVNRAFPNIDKSIIYIYNTSYTKEHGQMYVIPKYSLLN